MRNFVRIISISVIAILTVSILCGSVGAQEAKKYDVTEDGIVSSYYTVDAENKLITGIAPGTSAEKLLRTCVPQGLTASTDQIATGTTITYPAAEGEEAIYLTAVITGDLNGDGGVTISDMLKIKSYLLGDELSQLATIAGDLNFDEKVSITDFLKVKSFLLGLESIETRQNITDLLLLMPGSTDSWSYEGAASYEADSSGLIRVSSDGTITACEEEGSAFVYALAADGTVLARQLVTVLDEPLTFSLGMESCTIPMGKALTLTPVFNHPVSPKIAWMTSDETVVTVENGVLTAQQFGNATVTAALNNGYQVELPVTVAPPITELAIERALYKIKPGHTKNLTVLMSPADSGEELIWTTSDPDIATVSSDGTVTGVNYGTCTITATGKYSGLSDTCDVKICDVIQVALTFDDGPSDHTKKLLDFLKENDIRVTFFLVGNRMEFYSSTVQREAAEGHEIGYHSYAHKMQPSLTSAQITGDFEKSDNILFQLTGQHFTLWRTPGGDYNDRVTSCVPLPHIMWNEDTLDWKNRNAYTVYNYIIRRANDGDIFLMHDLHKTTVDGAIMAMEEMMKGDYEFLTVTELLSRNGTPPENGKTYFSDK